MLRLRPISNKLISRAQFESNANEQSISEGVIPPKMNKYFISRANAHVRYKIDLVLPCINSVLCGSGYNRAARLLGEKGTTIDGLAKFTLCYDIEEGDFRTTSDCVGLGKDYLMNGEALRYLIDKLEPSMIVKETLESILSKAFGVPFAVGRGSGEFNAYSVWKCSQVKLEDTEPLAITQEDIDNAIDNAAKKFKLLRVDMLINLLNSNNNDDKLVREYLKDMLTITVLPVMPLATRPSLGTQTHFLTAAYRKLLNHNSDYSVYQDAKIEEYREYYKTLYSYVNTIVCSKASENGLDRDRTMSNVTPQLTLMKGKSGSIRSKMLSKRQDYSGRAAVVINPYMPVDTIGIPRTIAPKLYRLYALRDEKLDNQRIQKNLSSSDFDDVIIKQLEKSDIIKDIPIMLGRNPTLHKHGIQGFKVKLTSGRAIEVSPLVCPAFNMDFDGDTAHTELPVTPAAAREVEKLIRTDRNVLLPKTAESTIVPRMDILYGLYICTKNGYTAGSVSKSYATSEELLRDLTSLKIKVWDTATLEGYGTDLAGRVAFLSCFPKSVATELGAEEITSKSIKKYINAMLPYQGHGFNHTINCLVSLGFHVANLYCGSVSILTELHNETEAAKEFDKAYDNFHEKMKPIDELNDYGFYDSETYSIEYGKNLDKVKKTHEAGVYDKIGDSMFAVMAKSGARGNNSNLTQIFGSKGRIQKSESESFNVTLEHSLRDQLTPMEQMISAHGARRGQIAKSIKTADTGYLTRKLVHGTASIIITEDDCGTTEGITIRAEDIYKYLSKENATPDEEAKARSTVKDVMQRFITGRCDMDGIVITKARAKEIAESSTKASIKIRSPLTCKNPCCKKCYGVDPSNGRMVRLGTPVGILADHSLSEPSTQLTMKVFQKGGVQGSASSAFDRLKAVLEQTDIRAAAKDGKYPTYDPVAWAPGILMKTPFQGKRVLLHIVPDNPADIDKYNYKINRIIPEGISVKSGMHVERGEFLRIEHGDVYVPELEEAVGSIRAALEEVYCLYFLFRSECDLVPIHIETVVSNLIGYKPMTTNLEELKVGKHYTRRQLCVLNKDYSGTRFVTHVRGQLTAITDNVNFMESLIMEDQRLALSDAVLNGLVDMADSPLVQVTFGWYPELGTRVNPEFLDG